MNPRSPRRKKTQKEQPTVWKIPKDKWEVKKYSRAFDDPMGLEVTRLSPETTKAAMPRHPHDQGYTLGTRVNKTWALFHRAMKSNFK